MRSKREERSELECFVLGLVWQIGPCSPYELRTQMARSPSSQWSASAGAIYPLVRRLQRASLLTSAVARTGRRQRREYRITPKGKRVLRQWIGPPLSQQAVTVSHDPLRTRARFLALLDPSERKAWVAAALRALDEVERQVRTWAEEIGDPDDPFAACLTHSGTIDVAGRRKWLEFVGNAAARSQSRSGAPGGKNLR